MDCLALKKLVYFRDMFYRLRSFQIVMRLTESASFKAMPGAVLIGGGIKQAITLLYRDISNVNAVSNEHISFTMSFDLYLETIIYLS